MSLPRTHLFSTPERQDPVFMRQVLQDADAARLRVEAEKRMLRRLAGATKDVKVDVAAPTVTASFSPSLADLDINDAFVVSVIRHGLHRFKELQRVFDLADPKDPVAALQIVARQCALAENEREQRVAQVHLGRRRRRSRAAGSKQGGGLIATRELSEVEEVELDAARNGTSPFVNTGPGARFSRALF